jgi:hypothetical protein
MFSVRVRGTHKGNVACSALLHDEGGCYNSRGLVGILWLGSDLRDEVMRSPCGCHRMKEIGVLVTCS